MQNRIDIVIPVFNRAHCLPGLFAELEKQTFRDFRAIFVDDGSQDDSYEVLRVCAEGATFPCTIIRQENRGAGAARNAGMGQVEAEWFAFVDSDDGLVPEYLEYLVSAAAAEQADLAVSYMQMIPDSRRGSFEPAGELSYRGISGAACMKLHLTNWFGPCTVLYHRDFQRKHQLYFDEQCFYCEDAPFLMEVFAAAEKVALVNNRMYLYYLQQGSLSRSATVAKYVNGIQCFRRTEERLLGGKTDAAAEFGKMGAARYYVAILRRAAAQMKYPEFLELTAHAPLERYRDQFFRLPRAQQLACRMYCVSKSLFYAAVHCVFRD